MIEATGYTVVVGFTKEKSAKELKAEIQKQHSFIVGIIKAETVI